VGRLVVSRQLLLLSRWDEEERLRRRPLVFKGMDGQPDADRHQPGRKDEADAAP
jgi:hypothetical protein